MSDTFEDNEEFFKQFIDNYMNVNEMFVKDLIDFNDNLLSLNLNQINERIVSFIHKLDINSIVDSIKSIFPSVFVLNLINFYLFFRRKD